MSSDERLEAYELRLPYRDYGYRYVFQRGEYEYRLQVGGYSFESFGNLAVYRASDLLLRQEVVNTGRPGQFTRVLRCS